MRILVTGCAGFIGSNLVDRLLTDDYEVIGVDNFNDYYDPKIKRDNLKNAQKSAGFKLFELDILDYDSVENLFKNEKVAKVIHLAARAGVRPSINHPRLYAQVNVLGTVNLLKLCTEYKIKQFIFGSSSSVYGQSKTLPFDEGDLCENIISPYGASKRAAEFFVESFYHSFGQSAIILRFFTVYGERSRPDMAPALFANAILSGEPIVQFGNGSSSRDYTYIGDVVNGIISTIESNLNFEIINLGNNHPVKLSDFISTLEELIGRRAAILKKPVVLGDVDRTWANIARAKELLGWEPKTSIEEGLRRYIKWLKSKD